MLIGGIAQIPMNKLCDAKAACCQSQTSEVSIRFFLYSS